jgi:hypothetical protein
MLAALLVIMVVVVPPNEVAQTLQPDGPCWEPDIEFPVPCDDDEE